MDTYLRPDEAAAAASARRPRKKRGPVRGAKRIRLKELPAFSRQLAALYRSGIPVVQSLAAAMDQTTDVNFKRVLAEIRRRVEGGATLSAALAHYPEVFGDLYVNMMEAAEASGQLAEVLARVAEHLEAQVKLRNKVRSALMYPIMVTVVCFLITTGILIFIVPVFEDIYLDWDADLPGPTQFLVALSNLVRNQALWVIAFLIAFGVGLRYYVRTDAGGMVWDRLRLRFPIFGDLITKVSMARFASTFAQLIRAGVPILQAMDITAHSLQNRSLAVTVRKARDAVERGEPMSETLSADARYPRMLVHMLSAGERSGTVDEMFDNIAALYEDEVANTLAGLTSLIEPLLIVFLGVVVGGIVVCLFLPIFKMHEIIAI